MWTTCENCLCEEDPACVSAKTICSYPSQGVSRRCLITGTWYNETPHKVTTFTGIAGFDFGRTCVVDVVGRIWRKRATPTWHIYDVVHTAASPLTDIAFVVRRQGYNEQQSVAISGAPTGGTFTLTFDDTGSNPQTTAALAWNATTVQVKAAIEALSNIDLVTVSGGALPALAITIEFQGNHEYENVRKLTVDVTNLTGPDPITATVQTVVGGSSHLTTGVAVGDAGTLLRSVDNGATWSVVASGTSEDMARVVGSGRYWYAVGENGAFLRSTDHGVTWSLISTGSSEDLLDIAESGPKLWIAGTADLLRSTDRGTTWSPVAGVSDTKTSVVTDSDNTTWVFTSAVGTAGKVSKTIDQGANWTAYVISGTVNNIARRSLFYNGLVYVSSSSSVTLSPYLFSISQSITRYGSDLYICRESDEKPLPFAGPSLCPADDAAASWTVRRIDSAVEFGDCDAARATNGVAVLIQDPRDPTWPPCFWKSNTCVVTCEYPDPPTGPLAIWELDTSSDPITLTFSGSSTAVYTLPAADWNHNAANLMQFASGTGADANHAELWLCPGDWVETFPCRYCWDRCEPFQQWSTDLVLPTSYTWSTANWGLWGWDYPGSTLGLDPNPLILTYLSSGAWGIGNPYEGCVSSSWLLTGSPKAFVCNFVSVVASNSVLSFNTSIPGFVKIQFVFAISLPFASPGGGLVILQATYRLDVACDPAHQTMDCSIPRTLVLVSGASSFQQNPGGPLFIDGDWSPNSPVDDLPQTITITPF